MDAGRARSVLIVEDEGIFAEDLRDSLARQGYDAFAIAVSSDEAIRCVAERVPDIILMDIRIEGQRDGIDTVALLRASYDGPVIYLTAHTDEMTFARARATEPHGYLVKPVHGRALRSTIELSLHRHAIERSQKQRRSELEIAGRLASLGRLCAGLAHEINNPLASVVANAEFARDEIDSVAALLRGATAAYPELAERLRQLALAQVDIAAAGSRIAEIIAELTDFARPALPPSGEADVAHAIASAVRRCGHELRGRARLVHRADPLPLVQGDPARLTRVFVQLLRNAAQAIPVGRIADHEVSIAAHRESDRVIVEVRDDGDGISAEQLPRIFDPFFTTRTVGEGRGLGLSLCHGIVRSLGGDIQVASQRGAGTLVRVGLRVAAGLALPPGDPARTAPRGRILLVDDAAMLRRTMQHLLRDHDAVCVDNAGEALALLARGETFDVIMCDLMMPGMSGIDLHRQIARRDGELAGRIVFLTDGAPETQGAAAVVRTLPNLVLETPFGPSELTAAVAQLLARRH